MKRSYYLFTRSINLAIKVASQGIYAVSCTEKAGADWFYELQRDPTDIASHAQLWSDPTDIVLLQNQNLLVQYAIAPPKRRYGGY